MKSFKLSSGKVSLQPRLVLCYKSVIESLQELMKRDGFHKCANNGAKNFMQIAMIYIGISTMESVERFFSP